jgi:hypothetical protein
MVLGCDIQSRQPIPISTLFPSPYNIFHQKPRTPTLTLVCNVYANKGLTAIWHASVANKGLSRKFRFPRTTARPTPAYRSCYVLQIQDLQRSVVYVLQLKDLVEKLTSCMRPSQRRHRAGSFVLATSCCSEDHASNLSREQIFDSSLQTLDSEFRLLNRRQKLQYNALSSQNTLPTCIIMHFIVTFLSIPIPLITTTYCRSGTPCTSVWLTPPIPNAIFN